MKTPDTKRLGQSICPLSLLHIILTVCVGTLTAMSASAEGANFQAQYFSGLRQRGLFEIAETYGREQLGRNDLVFEERLELTLELARTLADHAVHSAQPNQQSLLWTEARETLNRLISTDPPQVLQLQFQAADLDAMQGRSLRYQVQLSPYDQVLRESATQLLKKSITGFHELQQLAQQKLEAIQQTNDLSSPYTKPQLNGLELQAKQREAAVLVDLGMVLPDQSPDRAVALLDAEKRLNELPKLKYTPAPGKAGELHLLLAQSLRMRGRHDQALRVLAMFSKPGVETAIGDRATAERIRVLLSLGRTDEAAKVIDDFVLAGRTLPGELAFLDVQILSEQWKKSAVDGPPTAATGLLQQLQERAKKVRRETGGYWGERAWSLWELSEESAKLGPELALQIRSARALYSHGKITAAIEEYATAASSAFQSGQPDLAFDLAFTRASLQLRAKQFSAAENAFGELLNRFPDNPRAAETSLLRAYALGQVYNKHRTKSRREAYTAALEKHRNDFAEDPTAASATWMLAQLQEQRLQTSVALGLYQSIPSSDKRKNEAQIAVARCYDKILSRLRALNRPVEDWRRRAVVELNSYLPERSEPRRKLNEPQSVVATYLARVYLNAQNPEFAEADLLLEWVFESLAQQEDSTLSESVRKILATATQLRIVSLAGQQQLEQAGKLLNQLSQTEPAEMLRILNGLSQLVDIADEAGRRDLGILQLQAVEKLEPRRDQLTPPQSQRLDQCRAQAYVATGRIDDAVELYETLRKASPKDRDLQTNQAQVLVTCGSRRCLKQGRKLWQELEASYKSGSKQWLNARYYRALCAYELDDFDVCYKLLGIAAQLYPDLGSPELQAQYQELQEKCAARRKENGTQTP